MEIAKRINTFIDSENIAPNYASSSLGKINYESIVYTFAKIVGYYNTNSNLPTYVSMNSETKISASPSGGSAISVFSLDQIQKAATNVKKYIETNHKLPNYVTVGTTQIKPVDFLRLMIIGAIEIGDDVKMPASLKAVGTPGIPLESIKSGNLTEASYLDLAKRLKTFIDANGKIPNHATTPLGEIKYESMIFLFAKILSFEDTNSRLPSYVSVTPWSIVSTPASAPVPSDLQKYLAATANCQVNNAQIKALAASITSGKTTTYAKAAAIFNWVRNNLGYSFYYNTKYGAVGALNARTGNCVDTAHLIVALERAAGIPARYVHGTARFPSGSVYGHVWAQVWVNGKWYTADGTSSKNTFGSMVASVLAIKGYYASLPF
jgi:transglutaminase-like putative cysteine protease